MNEIMPKVFEYQGSKVRTALVDGEPMFAGKDVCEVLELGNHRQALSRLDEDEKGVISTDTLGGSQEMVFVTESGLYSLILSSRKPEAKSFKRWITHEVIPAIRKTGRYEVARSIPRTYAEALEEAARLERERLALAERVEVLEPKGEMYDLLLSAKNAQTMGEVAKAFGWGRNKLFAHLRGKRILMRNNLPYQQYLESGYFEVREVNTNRGECTINVTQTLVTPKGIDFIGRTVGGRRAS